MTATDLSIPLRVTSTSRADRALHREPVTGGVPIPRGAVRDLDGWRLLGPRATTLPLQLAATERWPDGSLRWVLVDTQVDRPTGVTGIPLTLEHGGSESDAKSEAAQLSVHQSGNTIAVDTGVARFQLGKSAGCVIKTCDTTAGTVLDRSALAISAEGGRPWRVEWDDPVVDVTGPLRSVVSARGRACDDAGGTLDLRLRLEFFAGRGAVRLTLTVGNPRRAQYPGGIWNLGDPGSVFLTEFSLSLRHVSSQPSIRWSAEPGPFGHATNDVRIYQDSSGGGNWASTNHVDCHGHVTTRFRGFEVEADGIRTTGLRASPTVVAGQGASQLGVAVPAFWQNFPRTLRATPAEIRVSFFPTDSGQAHELQGGEQKTHECYLLFGDDDISEAPLGWCHSRPVLHAEPRWYVESQALRDFVTAAEDDAVYRSLVDAAIDGSDTFLRKREVADEYGWRHFGDIYGDHEGVKHRGATPLMSHYNNQYDPVGGFLYQFWRTGDSRWWTQCLELAAHVVDIDIYHTDQDKSAYNRGLFWHTCHYIDADRATHRSYPTGTSGGGPSSEQNYSTGLMLHHLATGDPTSREAALGLAQFVLHIEDGTRTMFRWLDRGDTGIASASKTPDYHGPGRGSGNSLNALVDGHRMSGERRFLDKAEQIVRRCTHPRQNIEHLGLLDAENRWFYTMYLQSLGKYLEWKAELGELDAMYAYGRDVLLHFTRWMASHERPTLDGRDRLEHPTETWPAQDIRKSEIFDVAARYTDGDERETFLERAEFFFRYSTSTLRDMPTRTLARPVVILLAHGYRRSRARLHGVESAPAPVENWEARWPKAEVFVPQKSRAIRRAKQIAALAATGGVLIAARVLWWLFR